MTGRSGRDLRRSNHRYDERALFNTDQAITIVRKFDEVTHASLIKLSVSMSLLDTMSVSKFSYTKIIFVYSSKSFPFFYKIDIL